MKFVIITFFVLAGCNKVFGQEQSLLNLPEVNVSGQSFQFKDTSNRLETNLLSMDIADQLWSEASIMIRQNSPGGAITFSYHGGSSYQIPVLWKGVNINSRMHGNFDASLVPFGFFDHIYLDPFPTSNKTCSGNISGSIHLENKTLRESNYSEVSLNFNTLGNESILLNNYTKSGKIENHIKLFSTTQDNRYDYFFKGDNLKYSQNNASFTGTQILNELSYYLNKDNILEFNIWSGVNNRELPKINPLDNSPAIQKDYFHRLVISHQRKLNKIQFQNKLGAINENILYADSLTKTRSSSSVHSFLYQGDLLYELNNKHSVFLGVQSNYLSPMVDDYTELKDFGTYKWYVIHQYELNKLRAEFSVGNEFFNNVQGPITGYINFNHTSTNSKATLHISRNYRFPTLNDLFWKPGGNANLKPEHSLDINFKYLINNDQGKYSLFVFTRKVDDWIQWIPSAGLWSAQNVSKVWSRGIDLGYEPNIISGNKLKVSLANNLSVVKSTTNYDYFNSENDEKFQILFTPILQYRNEIRISYSGWQLSYFNQFQSKSYITTDNSNYIDGFILGAFNFQKAILLNNRSKANIGAGVRNLYNTNYSHMPGRSMALRFFTINLSITFNQ